MGKYQLVEVRVAPIRKSYGILDHYYFVINDKEYHPGRYTLGNILPVGTTKNYHIVYVKTMCLLCYENIVSNFNLLEDRRVVKYFPFINCETLSTGISCQSLAFLSIPFIIWAAFKRYWVVIGFLLLITALYLMAIGRYMRLGTRYGTCSHIKYRNIENSNRTKFVTDYSSDEEE